VQVFPILLKNQKLPRETILNCRLVNKWTKTSVDQAIYQQQPDGITDCRFESLENIQTFIARTEGFVGNPFITKRAVIWSVGFYHVIMQGMQLVLDILHRFGHELWDLDVDLFISAPQPFMLTLIRVLNCVPNIRSLRIEFPTIEKDDESWAEFAGQATLPALENLTELTVDIGETHGRYIPVPSSFVRPVLLAYGDQLTRLNLGCFVFRGDPWEAFLFPNLRYLAVNFDSHRRPRTTEVCNNIKKLVCPNLKILELCGSVIFTADTFLVFNAFRDSLIKLCIDGRLRLTTNIFQVDPLDIQEFPKLVLLTTTVGENSFLWNFFRNLFPNLEDLRILKWKINVDKKVSAYGRRKFFEIFPRLKRLTLMDEETESWVVEFTRESFN